MLAQLAKWRGELASALATAEEEWPALSSEMEAQGVNGSAKLGNESVNQY